LRYVDKIKNKIPRSEMDEIYTFLIRAGIEYDNDMDVRICGSYRREKDTSNDIDVIISHPNIKIRKDADKSNMLHGFIELLKKKKFIIDSFTSDDVPTKYMGVCKLSNKHLLRRIDVRFIAQESYYTAILYFTGSDEFNKRMRSVALTMGYTLNEYRLLNNKNIILPVNSEQDVFNYLNMEYVVPSERV
jgi:DNA polymerase beta